jgi:hypothetical protein
LGGVFVFEPWAALRRIESGVGNMFQFKRDFEAEYVGPRDLDYARTLNPELQDFDTWLAANAEKIPLG